MRMTIASAQQLLENLMTEDSEAQLALFKALTEDDDFSDIFVAYLERFKPVENKYEEPEQEQLEQEQLEEEELAEGELSDAQLADAANGAGLDNIQYDENESKEELDENAEVYEDADADAEVDQSVIELDAVEEEQTEASNNSVSPEETSNCDEFEIVPQVGQKTANENFIQGLVSTIVDIDKLNIENLNADQGVGASAADVAPETSKYMLSSIGAQDAVTGSGSLDDVVIPPAPVAEADENASVGSESEIKKVSSLSLSM